MKRFLPLNLFQASAFRVWLLAVLVALAVFTLTRGVLLLYSWHQLDQTLSTLLPAFLLGVLRDIPVAGAVATPFIFFELLLPTRWRASPAIRGLRLAFMAVYIFTLLFVSVSEFIFWDEFGVRFNFIALDYLVFTTEVIGNIRESYPVGTILTSLAVLTGFCLYALRNRVNVAAAIFAPRLGQLLLGLTLCVLAWGGMFRLKPPEFAVNAYANELADNGWRSFIWAARQNRLDYRQFYAVRPDEEVLARLSTLSGSPQPAQVVQSMEGRFIKTGAASGQRPPNVVVVMMESLSAEYMGTFGNTKGLTPNLDALAEEGVLFTRLFAAGTRTVRGLESLSAALPPLPGKSIVRWPERGDLDTLGKVMGRNGWNPYFIYGGYGMFDNMNEYFSRSGYQVRDRMNFPEDPKVFTNIWGVADENLFDEVIRTMDRETALGAPVFAHVMTTSNHVPFTYPDGRIDIPSPGGRPGGIKYADYAVGHFIAEARKKPWFDNTIFLFVADHCARSAGKTSIPVYRYHIPAIIYAPKLVEPRRVDTLVSQIDLAPTLLNLVGLGDQSTFVGRDALAMKPEEGRALLSTYQNLGYLKGDILTVLSPRRKVEAFRVREDKDEAKPVPVDPVLKDEAIAYFQGAAILMERHLDAKKQSSRAM